MEIRWLGEINVELGDLEGRLCSCGKKILGLFEHDELEVLRDIPIGSWRQRSCIYFANLNILPNMYVDFKSV